MDKEISSFIWDPERELANVAKHGVDFITAAKAFKDPKRKSLLILNTVRGKRDSSALGKLRRRF